MVGLSQAPSARWLALALDAGQVAAVGLWRQWLWRQWGSGGPGRARRWLPV